nr:hypothetical protein [Tanacetum cinerariifolium]
MATMQQLANLLSGFQKQFPPTNNQLRASSNPMSQATVQAGQIVTKTVQRSAPGNVGKQGKRENQANGSKEKGEVLDAEAEAFLADVECTTPYEGQLAMNTTKMFQANHEDAYDSDVDDGPDASIVFMAKKFSTGSLSSSNNISINEVQTNDADDIFGVVSYPLSQELHQEDGIESDNESLPEENMISYSEHKASNDEHHSGSYLQIPASTFLDLNAQITSLYKVNEER